VPGRRKPRQVARLNRRIRRLGRAVCSLRPRQRLLQLTLGDPANFRRPPGPKHLRPVFPIRRSFPPMLATEFPAFKKISNHGKRHSTNLTTDSATRPGIERLFPHRRPAWRYESVTGGRWNLHTKASTRPGRRPRSRRLSNGGDCRGALIANSWTPGGSSVAHNGEVARRSVLWLACGLLAL
jgi:hypothetical protein